MFQSYFHSHNKKVVILMMINQVFNTYLDELFSKLY